MTACLDVNRRNSLRALLSQLITILGGATSAFRIAPRSLFLRLNRHHVNQKTYLLQLPRPTILKAFSTTILINHFRNADSLIASERGIFGAP